MDARLVLPIAGSAGPLFVAGGPPPLAIGYRGRGFGVFVGPYFDRQKMDLPFAAIGPDGSTMTPVVVSSTVSRYGVSVIGDGALAQSSDRMTDLHAFGSASLAGNTLSTEAVGAGSALGSIGTFGGEGVSGHASFGFAGGLGVRHWLTPHLGFGAEIGESYANNPVGIGATFTTASDGTSVVSGKRSLRASSFATFGTIDISLVL